jgi:hypothetical protein
MMAPIDQCILGQCGIKSELHSSSLTATRNKVISIYCEPFPFPFNGLIGPLDHLKNRNI